MEIVQVYQRIVVGVGVELGVGLREGVEVGVAVGFRAGLRGAHCVLTDSLKRKSRKLKTKIDFYLFYIFDKLTV